MCKVALLAFSLGITNEKLQRSKDLFKKSVSIYWPNRKEIEDILDNLSEFFTVLKENNQTKKVSKLLAVMYIVSATSKHDSIICNHPTFTESFYAAYFHQASVGTHYNSLSHSSRRYKGLNISGSSATKGLLRIPNTIKDIEEHAKNVLEGLPSTTIVVMSFLENTYNNLIQEFLSREDVKTWILVSRLSSKMEPFVVLLPVFYVSQDEKNTYEKRCSLVDYLVPELRQLLEEFCSFPCYSASFYTKMYNIEESLNNLLRNLEESWLGSWKCILQGELVNCQNFDSVVKKLNNDITSHLKSDVNELLLKLILGGFCKEEILIKKEGYIAKVGRCADLMHGIVSKIDNESQKSVLKLLCEASCELKVDDDVKRGPIILVLDDEMMMFPLESMPILRKEEVYRMPSVNSIYTLLDRHSNHKEKVGRNLMSFPSIDPLNAFYLLNPSGDVTLMQTYFENYINSEKLDLKGKAGSEPSVEELVEWLESYDLFLYMSHNGGEQYISSRNVTKLKKCSAAILSGCSSGILTLHGCYAPTSIPQSYLLAGSPFIIATLWTVLTRQMGPFTRVMHNGMRKERSNLSGDRIGAILSQARELCTLNYLTGASTVCYGVPTWIKKREEI